MVAVSDQVSRFTISDGKQFSKSGAGFFSTIAAVNRDRWNGGRTARIWEGSWSHKKVVGVAGATRGCFHFRFEMFTFCPTAMAPLTLNALSLYSICHRIP